MYIFVVWCSLKEFTMNNKEEYYKWYDCDEFPSYQINKMGQIRNITTGIVLKGTIGRHCYLCYSLRKDGKVYTVRAHVLVAKQFIPNPSPNQKTIVNHIDENKLNSCIDNLEWASSKENSNHGTANKRKAEKLEKPINEYDLDGKYRRTWRSTKAIVEFLQGEVIDDTRQVSFYNAVRMYIKYNQYHDEKKPLGHSVFLPYNNSCEDIEIKLYSSSCSKPRKYKKLYAFFTDNLIVPDVYLFNPNKALDSYMDILKELSRDKRLDNGQQESIKYAIECMKLLAEISNAIKKRKI